MTTLQYCDWLPLKKPDYVRYHDEEWGVPVYDDNRLFEMLILEGAQAGLNWYSILKRREGYRTLFQGFCPEKVAVMSDEDLEILLTDERIIRHRLKIYTTRQNGRVFCEIQREFGSFQAYLWGFVEGKPLINRPQSSGEIPAHTPPPYQP